MASQDFKELPVSAGQPENVESSVHDNSNIAETKEGFLTAVEDDKTDKLVVNEGIRNDSNSKEANANNVVAPILSGSTVDASTPMVDGHEGSNEGGKKNVGNDSKAEAISSNSNKETKKVLRKRKKNIEEASDVSSPSTTLKKKLNDTSALKVKEAQPSEKSIEDNEKKELKSDEKVESVAISEDEKEKAGREAKKTVKKVVTKKNVPKAKGASSNCDSLPIKSVDATTVAPTSDTPAVTKEIDGTEKNSSIDTGDLNSAEKTSPSAAEKPLKADDADKPSPSATKEKVDSADKLSKKVDGMGLVFICNAKTKRDCFKYNVLGLPKSKKDLVAKIYKGMRLFLFDVDLKLMYGIYKAAGPGGYNLEPKAFDSKFPSQVRFTVLRDSLPLPEEKFKAAIKENYYKRSHFDCQLSPEQVKNLCKLFENASKSSQRTGALRPLTNPGSRGLKRRPSGRFEREVYRSPPRARYQSPPRLRYQSPPRVRYQLSPPRARYPSPPPRALPVHSLPRSLPYAYEQPLVDDYYRREQPRALEQDPYLLYREPARYPDPVYPPSLASVYGVRQPRSPPRYLY